MPCQKVQKNISVVLDISVYTYLSVFLYIERSYTVCCIKQHIFKLFTYIISPNENMQGVKISNNSKISVILEEIDPPVAFRLGSVLFRMPSCKF